MLMTAFRNIGERRKKVVLIYMMIMNTEYVPQISGALLQEQRPLKSIAMWMSAADVLILQLWTDAKSRELIATEYPWFLSTFDEYPQPIQRADAIRYFVLAHYGGIYIDLDDVRPYPHSPMG